VARTLTSPPCDKGMWRLLLARVHPDSGGSHDLFVWAGELRALVCGVVSSDDSVESFADEAAARRPSSRRKDPARVAPEDAFSGDAGSFGRLTRRAVALADEVDPLYGRLLRSLADCREASDGPLSRQQRRGATYRQLAHVGHLTGMTKAERGRWYRLVRRVPLTERHAAHLVERLLAGDESESGAA
jgi:hypothetical protein